MKLGEFEYFCKELMIFRGLMSSKKHMENEEAKRQAEHGIAYVTFHTKENKKDAVEMLRGTLEEYYKRQVLMGITPLL